MTNLEGYRAERGGKPTKRGGKPIEQIQPRVYSFYPVLVFSSLCVGLLWSCSALKGQIGPEAAKVVKAYCEQPLAVRLATRSEINELIFPNEAKITCEGDPK